MVTSKFICLTIPPSVASVVVLPQPPVTLFKRMEMDGDPLPPAVSDIMTACVAATPSRRRQIITRRQRQNARMPFMSKKPSAREPAIAVVSIFQSGISPMTSRVVSGARRFCYSSFLDS